jgi:hypothetical protein
VDVCAQAVMDAEGHAFAGWLFLLATTATLVWLWAREVARREFQRMEVRLRLAPPLSQGVRPNRIRC